MKRTVAALIAFGVLALVAALAAGAAAGILYRRAHEPFKGYAGTEQFVEIGRGSAIRAIGQQLAEAGVIRDVASFRAALWLTGLSRQIQAGEYRFDSPMTATGVVEKLARGQTYERPLTFPESLTIAEMAAVFEEQGFGPAASFAAAAAEGSLVAGLDPAARDLEGYLFPETYMLPRRASAARLVRLMVQRFEQVLAPDLRKAAAANGLTIRQLVTLASLVEKETAKPEERAVVAAVYLNRVKRGMPLQCDPTVIYALKLAGRYRGNLTREDLAFDSPYNTYRYPGFPPGPIAAPGRGSLEAAARPEQSGYLYFVSRNDGSHVFARTLEEHNRNVQRFQVQYFRDKRLAEARARAAARRPGTTPPR